ncbi:MAG: pilus assembly PilX family protein, partial [Planctomycetota bacterium]
MKAVRKKTARKRCGAVLILSMIFVLIFSALAVSFAAFSGANVQLATNQQKTSQALATAESGLEVTRYWLDGIYVPSIVAESQRFQYISDYFQGGLDYYGITNIAPTYSADQIVIPAVMFDSTKNLTFDAIVDKISNDVLQLEITGHYGSINRKIRVQYGFYQRGNPIFDYGIASKGPLALEGKVDLSGANVAVESSVYIEAIGEPTALTLEGACSIAGDVSIVDPDAGVIVGDTSSIGGESGQAAIDNHVFRDAPLAEFPVPNPGYFEQYVEDGNDHIITSDVASNITIQNVRIPP